MTRAIIYFLAGLLVACEAESEGSADPDGGRCAPAYEFGGQLSASFEVVGVQQVDWRGASTVAANGDRWVFARDGLDDMEIKLDGAPLADGDSVWLEVSVEMSDDLTLRHVVVIRGSEGGSILAAGINGDLDVVNAPLLADTGLELTTARRCESGPAQCYAKTYSLELGVQGQAGGGPASSSFAITIGSQSMTMFVDVAAEGEQDLGCSGVPSSQVHARVLPLAK